MTRLGLLLVLCAACGSSKGTASADAARVEAPAVDAAPEGGAPASRFGLTARPTNTTCVAPAMGNPPARLLSETGCTAAGDAREPASGLIPYDVISPLWSDGAEKERFLALPEGTHITPTSADHWELPVGTVLVKTFRLGGRLIETRLLIRTGAFTWKGFSYEWNEAQTDAALLEDVVNGVKKPVTVGAGTQVWHFPSRAQCLQCHTLAAGVSLGPSTTQLDAPLRYPSGVESNQVATLAHIGLFASAPPRATPLPAPAGPATVAERARGYLHVNCAICHRPGGSFEGIDLRHGTPLGEMGLCNQAPEKGELGVAGALRLVPGDPGKSLLLLRMKALQEGRMPQIGTSVADASGVALVQQWIESLTNCP